MRAFNKKEDTTSVYKFCGRCGCKIIEITLNITYLKYNRETGMPYTRAQDFLVCSQGWDRDKKQIEEWALNRVYTPAHDVYAIQHTIKIKEWPELRKEC